MGRAVPSSSRVLSPGLGALLLLSFAALSLLLSLRVMGDPQAFASSPAVPVASPRVISHFQNSWIPRVSVRHGSSINLSWVPPATSAAVPLYPSLPRMRFSGEVEAHALLLQSRLLAAHAARADDASFVLLDVGCNAGSFSLYWATAGFHAYCVDVELTGGASGMGEFSWVSLAAANASTRVAARLTFFEAGIAAATGGWLAYAGTGHQYTAVASLADARGAVVRTVAAADLLGALPGLFLAKIDIDGGEIGALRSLLDSGRRVANIHVEVTPGYWAGLGVSDGEAAAVLADAEARYDVHAVFWREASQVCCRDIFKGPPPEAWATAPLGFVQRLPPGAFVPYVMQMAHAAGRTPRIGQRDFWLSEHGQNVSHMGEIRALRCADAENYADAFDEQAVCAVRHDG